MRNSHRRRVPVAVSDPRSKISINGWFMDIFSLTLHGNSVVDADGEKSSAAETLAMARAALTAEVLEIRTASSYE